VIETLRLPHSNLDGAEWHRVKMRWCYYCGVDLSTHGLTLDHVVPRSRGGLGAPYNKVPACAECNRDKGSEKLLTYLLRKPYGTRPMPGPTRRERHAERERRALIMAMLGVPSQIHSRRQKREYVRALLRQRRRLLTVLTLRAEQVG
jgi:hypothetical protein